MSSDIEIARKAKMDPIMDIGAKLNIPHEAMNPFGHFKAKLSSEWLNQQANQNKAKLIFGKKLSIKFLTTSDC